MPPMKQNLWVQVSPLQLVPGSQSSSSWSHSFEREMRDTNYCFGTSSASKSPPGTAIGVASL